MAVFKVVTLLAAIFATLMTGTVTEAQTVPSCSDLFKELTGKRLRVFANLLDKEISNGVTSELCVNFNTFRLERYYYCREGFTTFLPGVDTPDSKNNLSEVIDFDALRDELNTSVIVILCIPRPQPPSTPPPPAPTPISVGRCPRRPTRVNQYIRQDQTKLCKQSCSFGVSVFGSSIGTRTRTIYRCCSGEPILVSRASRLYRCP